MNADTDALTAELDSLVPPPSQGDKETHVAH